MQMLEQNKSYYKSLALLQKFVLFLLVSSF